MTEPIGAFMAAWVTAHEHDCGPVDLWARAPKREPESVVTERAAARQSEHLALARQIKQLRIGEAA